MTFSLFGCPLRGQRARKNPRRGGGAKKKPRDPVGREAEASGVALDILHSFQSRWKYFGKLEWQIVKTKPENMRHGITDISEIDDKKLSFRRFIFCDAATKRTSDNTNHK